MRRDRGELRERRWPRRVGIGLGILAAVLCIAWIATEVLAERWVDDNRARWSAQLSDRLQRPVRIGDIDVGVLLGRAYVDDLAIGPSASERKAGADVPAVQAKRVQVNIGVFRTLLSFGKRPYIQSVTVDGLRANVVKRRDGTFNWQEIADRLASEQGARAQRKAVEQKPDERMRNARLGDLRIPDAQVDLITLGEDRPVRISAIDLHVRDAGYYTGFDLALQAALAAPQRNLDLRASVGGMHRDAQEVPPRLRTVALRLAPTDIAPLARFAAGKRSPLQSGVLQADLRADGKSGQEGSAVKGGVQLTGGQYAGGQRFDAALDLDLSVARDGDALTVRKASLRAADMQLVAQGKLDRLRDAPRVRQLDVRSRGLDFDRLRTLYPELDRRTAPARLSGPVAITASGKGTSDASNATFALDLTGASIKVDDRFDKPRGTPFALNGQLSSKGNAVEFAPFTLQVADYRVLGRGSVADVRAKNPRFKLAVETPSPAINGVLALLPRVSRGVPRGVNAGSLAVHADIEGTRERYSGKGQLELSNLAANAQGARLDGGGRARFDIKRDGQQLRGSADADFSQLVAVYPGLIDKPERSPLTFAVRWDARGLGGKPEALRVDVPELQARAGGSDLRGSVRVQNADNPQIRAEASSNHLDPADFQLSGAEQKREQPRAKTPMQRALAKSDGRIALKVREGTAAGAQFQNLDADLRLHDGLARADKLQASAFGGAFDGKGSEFPLFAERAPYRIKGKVEGVGVDPVLQSFTGQGGVLDGKLGADLDVAAEGATLAELQQTLSGRLKGTVGDATFIPFNGETALVQTLSQAAQVPGLKEQLGSTGERVAEGKGWALRDLAGELRFEKGAVFIPENGIRARTPQGDLRLQGRIGMNNSDLQGTLMLEPKALAQLLGTDPGIKEPVPVSLRVRGSIANPQVAFVDLGPALRPALESFARAHLGAEGQKAVDQLEKALQGQGQRQGKGQGEQKQGERGAKPEDQLKKELQKQLPKLF